MQWSVRSSTDLGTLPLYLVSACPRTSPPKYFWDILPGSVTSVGPAAPVPLVGQRGHKSYPAPFLGSGLKALSGMNLSSCPVVSCREGLPSLSLVLPGPCCQGSPPFASAADNASSGSHAFLPLTTSPPYPLLPTPHPPIPLDAPWEFGGCGSLLFLLLLAPPCR